MEKMLLISGTPGKDYERFAVEALCKLRDHKVKSIVLAALTEGEGKAVTGYWNAGPGERAELAAHIQADAIDAMILANIDRYRNAALSGLDEGE